MSFGDQVSSDTGVKTSSGSSITVALGITVSVGQLIVIGFSGRSVPTGTSLSDGLGNSFTNLVLSQAGGNGVTLGVWYSVATFAGLCKPVFSFNSQSSDAALIVANYEGPWASTNDVSSAVISDVTTPFDCPTTGVLSQSSEMVMGFGSVRSGISGFAGTAPMTNVVQQRSATGAGSDAVVMGSYVVSSTGATTPEFTAGSNPNAGTWYTATFKASSTQQTAISTFAGAATFSLPANMLQVASAKFDVAGLFIPLTATTWLGTTTFEPVGAFSFLTFSAQAMRATYVGAGSLSAALNSNAIAIDRFVGAGAFSSLAFQRQLASDSFAAAGSFSALITLREAAIGTFAGAGGFAPLAFQIQTAIDTFALSGSLFARPTQQGVWQGAVTYVGAGVLSLNPNMISVGQFVSPVTASLLAFPDVFSPAVFTAAGAGSLLAIPGDVARALDAAAVFACSSGWFVNLQQIAIALNELSLFGNQRAAVDYVQCDIADKNTRYLYISYGQSISGRPTVRFDSPHTAESVVTYPQAQVVENKDVLTCRGLFPAGTYVKCRLDVTGLLSGPGVWSVSVSTPDTWNNLMTSDSKAQNFYMSVED